VNADFLNIIVTVMNCVFCQDISSVSASQSSSSAANSSDMTEMESLIKSLMSGDTSLLTQQLSGIESHYMNLCLSIVTKTLKTYKVS